MCGPPGGGVGGGSLGKRLHSSKWPVCVCNAGLVWPSFYFLSLYLACAFSIVIFLLLFFCFCVCVCVCVCVCGNRLFSYQRTRTVCSFLPSPVVDTWHSESKHLVHCLSDPFLRGCWQTSMHPEGDKQIAVYSWIPFTWGADEAGVV